MSEKKTQEEVAAPVAKVVMFVIAKVGEKYVRFADLASVPEGAEPITQDTAAEMTKDAIGEVYSTIAGVPSKKFKDKKIGLESLAYQVAKMRIFDPSAPAPAAKAEKPAKVAKVAGEKVPRAAKTPSTLELAQPENLEEALRGLAPQARELITIMADLAKSKGAPSFSSAELDEYIKRPEVAARLRTKQDPLRILQYYRGKLISAGFVRVS